MDAILSSSQGEEALHEALADTGLSPGEGVAVIGLLMDLESRAPLTRYREILLDEDADAGLSDAAAEAVIALGLSLIHISMTPRAPVNKTSIIVTPR